MNRRLMPFQGWRLTFFYGVIFAVFLLFSLRLYQFQFVDRQDFLIAEEDNRISELPIPAPRGVIFDRYDRPLAINVPAFNVTIVPAELPDIETEELDIFNRLSALTDVPPTRQAAIVANRNVRSIEELVAEGEGIAPFRPVIIAQDVPERVARQILEERLTLPGVDVQPVGVREYPTGEMTSQVIGYMGPIPEERAQELIEQGYNPAFDRIGYAGLEFFLENQIAGQQGQIVREVDVAGEPIRTIRQVDPVPGDNVRLTIDFELQEAAQTALTNRLTLLNTQAERIVSQRGVVMAMNPNTGEILAMVSWPTYDNTRFARAIDGEYFFELADDPLRPLVNNATQSLYPPGSVWKLITAVGVLEEDVIEPESQLFDAGSLVLENRYAPNDPAASQTFVCWLRSGHGSVNMIEGIAQSCDVYFYQIGGGNPDVSPQTLRPGGLGIVDLFRYATAMGIGSELGVELPGENAGRMPDADWKRRVFGENWSTGDTYNAAFGQGFVNVTPLQLISAVASIVNNGTLYQPTLIREFLDGEGNVIKPFEPYVMRTINISDIPPGEPLTLLLVEDMIMKGPNSLACTCEENSSFFNPGRCNPIDYTNTVDINPDPFLTELRDYRVHIPLNYAFNASVCDPLRFDPDYQPAFAEPEYLQIVREGMRAAVTVGTAQPANLTFINTAGKTGTAEYCDDVARPLGLCVPGNWPSHAWYTGYVPYEDPEVLIIGFIYNGGEGSLVALPVVVETMEAYLRLQAEREENTQVTNPAEVIHTSQNFLPAWMERHLVGEPQSVEVAQANE
ncbi:MAG: penicillin-binding protein 2 [Chloroflexi bacterium]|nr:MAG: penicillin-binding protein 2 [Chloroflexota bacterium]